MYEASERDFRVVAIEDAISGFYERGSELIGIGVSVLRAEEFIELGARHHHSSDPRDGR
jgi:hypothetical protein